MRKIFLLTFMVMTVFASHADVKTVCCNRYEYTSDNSSASPEEAREIALEKAKMKALEDAFGTDVAQMTQNTVKNIQKADGSASTLSEIFNISETSVKGDWLQTLEEKVLSTTYENGFWRVVVSVKGKAREKKGAETQIAATLGCKLTDKTDRTEFADGDDIFLRVLTPADGFLAVYLVDEEQNAYCLLPYGGNTLGYHEIEGNKEHILFSSTTDRCADEYTLNTQKESECNIVYVVFSPNNFMKAVDNRGGSNWREEELPRVLPLKNLKEWLGRNQIRDEKMVVQKKLITITK